MVINDHVVMRMQFYLRFVIRQVFKCIKYLKLCLSKDCGPGASVSKQKGLGEKGFYEISLGLTFPASSWAHKAVTPTGLE